MGRKDVATRWFDGRYNCESDAGSDWFGRCHGVLKLENMFRGCFFSIFLKSQSTARFNVNVFIILIPVRYSNMIHS